MLRRVRIKGLWSFADAETELGCAGRLDVVLGANGAGKSSLLNVFRMLRAMTGRGLAHFVASVGGASSVLHYGPKSTPVAELELEFDGPKGLNGYGARLVHVAPDRLVYADERVWYEPHEQPRREYSIGAGAHPESALGAAISSGDAEAGVARTVKWQLDRFCHYHFHDTSLAAAMRMSSDPNDTSYLRPDGANLAAYLHSMWVEGDAAYERVRETVARIFPRFDDFVFALSKGSSPKVSLRWRERGNSYEFGPHHLSDGTLRFLAYATLLLQSGKPGDETSPNFPQLVVVDEPELGLHPAALALLAGMLRAFPGQLLVATQSVELVNLLVESEVELRRLLLIDRDGAGSLLARPELAKLKPWLEDYAPAQLWTHGVLGALP